MRMFFKVSGTLLAGVASLGLLASAAQAETAGNADRTGGDQLNPNDTNGMGNNTGIRHNTTPNVNMNDTGNHGYDHENNNGGVPSPDGSAD